LGPCGDPGHRDENSESDTLQNGVHDPDDARPGLRLNRDFVGALLTPASVAQEKTRAFAGAGLK
jgi:hypothetical protein